MPDEVRRAIIQKSVKIVRARAFRDLLQLISVEFHDGVEIIEKQAFYNCRSLRSIKLLGVKIVKYYAFYNCRHLTDVEFGDKLETIEEGAFSSCEALKKIRIPSVRTVGFRAFSYCTNLSDVEFGEELRSLELQAFHRCPKLKRIVLPLKNIIIESDVFIGCEMLTNVDLVGGIHNTVASLHLESWRNEMNEEINGINQTLSAFGRVGGLRNRYARSYGGYEHVPTFDVYGEERVKVVKWWMRAVLCQLNHYKDEHRKLLKEATTLLELALWKSKLDGNDEDEVGKSGSRKKARKEIYVTSGASIVIKNVLPFLVLKS